MACVAAMAHRGEVGARVARGFNRSQHVAQEGIAAAGGPVFIGQVFGDCPSTVIAQAENSGQVRVLAAFASDGMSLRRHIETTVRPWLATKAPRVFTDRRLLLGAHDDTDSWELIEILEELLGGRWEPPTSPWDSRKDALLDLLAKATPFNFTPMLQIDGTNARLVVDALSGRWSYHKERTDRQNIFYHAANALSLAISRIAPETANRKREPLTVNMNLTLGSPRKR